MNLIFIGAFHS